MHVVLSGNKKITIFSIDWCWSFFHFSEVTCEECAAWVCIHEGKRRGGSGCKGDDNVCKIGNNQDGDEYIDKTPGAYNIFVSCRDHWDCAKKKLYEVCFN